MSTIAFDTLKFSERLEKAGVPREQAKAIAEAFNEAAGEDLVTRSYLDARLAEIKVDLIKWIVGLILGQTALLLAVLPRLIGH
jgi:hypothetical protein